MSMDRKMQKKKKTKKKKKQKKTNVIDPYLFVMYMYFVLRLTFHPSVSKVDSFIFES